MSHWYREIRKLIESIAPAIDLEAYHGSGAKFDQFEAGHKNGMSTPRAGFYVTDNEDAAAEFGKVSKYRIKMNHPADFTEGKGYSILQSLRANPDIERLVDIARERYGDKFEEKLLVSRLSSMGLLQGDDFVKALETSGYDGMIIEDDFAGHDFISYVIFDKNNIQKMDNN